MDGPCFGGAKHGIAMAHGSETARGAAEMQCAEKRSLGSAQTRNDERRLGTVTLS